MIGRPIMNLFIYLASCFSMASLNLMRLFLKEQGLPGNYRLRSALYNSIIMKIPVNENVLILR